MQLVSFLNKLFKEDGFILIDADSNKYIIGNPKKKEPITLRLLDKKLHLKLLFYPDLYFGEAYTDGTLEIKNGSLTDFLEIAMKNIGRNEINIFGRILKKIRGTYRYLTNFNLAKKSKDNAAHHYDISEDLYDLFLDPKRQYSCAYFKNENESLETAQNNKIDHIIKKLNLKPNQKVLDIGSGWGSLAIDIAKKTKCEVTGITLSENQYKYSLNKAKENNLENQVQFKLADYRNINEKFDRVVSVGMFEHVGRKYYKTFFRQVNSLLNDEGLALIHTIGSVEGPRDPQPWITKYIFSRYDKSAHRCDRGRDGHGQRVRDRQGHYGERQAREFSALSGTGRGLPAHWPGQVLHLESAICAFGEQRGQPWPRSRSQGKL